LAFDDTAAYIGETATICGVVASAEHESNDQPPRSLRTVSGSVTGKISDYRGKPEIVIADPNQVAE
jgi:hypothetical protein